MDAVKGEEIIDRLQAHIRPTASRRGSAPTPSPSSDASSVTDTIGLRPIWASATTSNMAATAMAAP